MVDWGRAKTYMYYVLLSRRKTENGTLTLFIAAHHFRFVCFYLRFDVTVVFSDMNGEDVDMANDGT